MNLALVLGQNSESVKPKLVSVKDNLNIECFTDLRNFINGSIKLDLMFDRIIIVSTLVKNESDITDLYNYWSNYSRQSEVVLLCRSNSDDNLAKAFLSKFCSTSVTSMSVTSTTLHTLSEAVVLPISKLVSMYGIPDYLAVEVEDDSYVEPETVKVEQSEVENLGTKISVNKTTEKRTLLGTLFGKKKKQQVQENLPEVDVNENIQSSDNSIEDSEINEQNQSAELSSDYIQQEEQLTDDYNDDEQPYDDSFSDDDTSNFEDSEENYKDNAYEPSLDDSDYVEDDFSEDTFNDTEQEYDTEVEEEHTEDDTSKSIFADEETDDFDFTSQLDTVIEETVDEDFGDLTFTDTQVSNLDVDESVNTHLEEVEDLDTDLYIGNAEEEYRQKTEQPRIIKETIVKEVIKRVKTSTVLENIYKGVAHKLIIVTGDRGSGLTTTAWSLALHFSQKVPVLYFDCDVVNHGLMNYIDYFEFKNYENSHMKGVKLCRDSKAFNTCTCKWDSNLDLLTTDFGVDVTDDELVLSQGIVAENLNKYGVVIVDCPLSKLHCIQDLILTGNVVLCVEDSKRGYMNTLVNLDYSELPLRYKRSIISKGTLMRTKVNPKNDYKRVIKYINGIVDLEDCNWLEMNTTEFTGKVTTEILTEILEG